MAASVLKGHNNTIRSLFGAFNLYGERAWLRSAQARKRIAKGNTKA